MNAHVFFLNLFKELRKNDKIPGLPSILYFFCNQLNKFNNTGARILDSFYHMTLELFGNPFFWREKVRVLPYYV